jgi:DNA polymerase/3'-5' exonuclease PolX
MDYKAKILEVLETLRKKELAEKELFKAKAYKTAIEELSVLPHIKSIDDVRGVKGVGKKIHAKLEEIFATGSLKAAEVAKEVVTKSEELLQCYGIGPAKVKELHSYGISTVAQLRTAIKKNSHILTPVQTMGLRYYEPLLLRIPRSEMREHEALLHKAIEPFQKGHLVIRANLVGSYRRGASSSGDIDMLLEGEDPTILIDLLHSLKIKSYIIGVLAHGARKIMAIVKLDGHPERHMDILLTSHTEYPFALAYFTGSAKFNIEMRKIAIEQGLTLNEHGLTTKAGIPVHGIRTEKDLFKALKIEWKEPEER